jgi:hypothetical protein
MRSLLSSPSWPDIDPSLNSVVTNPLTSPTARCATPRAGRASRFRRQPRGCRRHRPYDRKRDQRCQEDRHNLLYGPGAVPLRAEPACQVGKCQQTSRAERRLARRDHHERVRRYRVGPCCRQREQLPVLVVQVNPVLAPVQAVGDELEVPAVKRVEQVRHPEAPVPIARIGCS